MAGRSPVTKSTESLTKKATSPVLRSSSPSSDRSPITSSSLPESRLSGMTSSASPSGSTSRKPGTIPSTMKSPSITPRARASPNLASSKIRAPSIGDLDPVDSLSTPARNELVRLENVLKVKEVELAKSSTECKALRTTLASVEKAVSLLTEENGKLNDRLAMADKIIESKALELKEIDAIRKQALSDKNAADAVVRRLQAAYKKPGDNPAEIARAALEAELKLAHKEILGLREEIKTQVKSTRSKEQALLESERSIEAALSKAALHDECENRLQDLARQLEKSQEDTKTVDRMYKQKVEEVKQLSGKNDELQEALLVAGRLTNVVKDLERRLEEQQANEKGLNEELARAKVAASRVAMAVANEYKDDNDKVIPMKQWLEERRIMNGEIAKLKEKVTLADKAMKYEIQMKNKAQSRLKVIEESLKASGKSLPAEPSSASRTALRSPHAVDGSSMNLQAESADEDENPEREDVVSGVLYDALQRELLTLRKALQDRENAFKDKEASNDMLLKKVELLMRAMDTDSRKYRRELTTLKEEIASLKAELQTRPRHSSHSSPRVPARG